MRRSIAIASALLLTLGAVGCRRQSNQAPTSGQPSGAPSAEAPAQINQPPAERPLAEPVTVLVSITGGRFLPTAVNAQVGDTVKWTNEDTVTHTVTGGPFSSPRLAPGESYQVVVTEAGTVSYGCTLHPAMAGQVIVRPAQ